MQKRKSDILELQFTNLFLICNQSADRACNFDGQIIQTNVSLTCLGSFAEQAPAISEHVINFLIGDSGVYEHEGIEPEVTRTWTRQH